MKRMYYPINNTQVELHFHEDTKEIMVSQKGVEDLLEIKQYIVARFIKRVVTSEDEELQKLLHKLLHKLSFEREVFAKNGKNYSAKAYPLELFKLLEKELNKNIIDKVIKWTYENYSNNDEIGDVEIIRYNRNNFALDISVSPKEETIWLTREQISLLFERDISVITRHINNILKENELDKESISAKNAHMLINGRQYFKEFFNLDMILAIGYRINSRRGIEFRRWASKVLKNYMLKGYALDENRLTITSENYQTFMSKVFSLEERISKLEVNEKARSELLFTKNEVYDAYIFVQKLLRTAKREIIIIDPYLDMEVLSTLKVVDSNIYIKAILSNYPYIKKKEIKKFVAARGNMDIKFVDTFHDRFIILDKEVGYHLGTSLNSVGKRTFMISKIETKEIVDSLISLIK